MGVVCAIDLREGILMKSYQDFNVIVFGAGTMGLGIAQVLAAGGLKTYVTDLYAPALESAKERLDVAIDGLMRDGLADEEYRARVKEHLVTFSTDKLPEIGEQADLVVEVIIEDAAAKKELYQQIDEFCSKDCIVASNTSGMDVFSVASDVLSNPGRLIITHWFNPPHLMKLVEVVRGEQTSDETVEVVRGLLEYIGKKPAVLNKFAPGFIVNRIATVINRELYSMIEQGWITGEDAETAIRYTNGLRYGFEGPLGLWDFVGLEIPMTVAAGVLPSLYNATDRMPLGDKLIAEGKTGVKAGEGVLKYGSLEEHVAKRNRRIIQMTKVLEEWDKEDERGT